MPYRAFWPITTSTTGASTGTTPPGLGLSFQQLLGWYLLMFPASWVAEAINGQTKLLTGGTATEALFTAMVNTMTVPGDWTFPTTSSVSNLQLQLRLKTMTGNALDHALVDFFGLTLPRNLGETDAAYLARAQLSLFNTPRITAPNVRAFLLAYTGQQPHFIDPYNAEDVGGWSGAIGSIITMGGKSVFASLVTSPQTGQTAPPCYYGTDVEGAPFRYATPNGNQALNFLRKPSGALVKGQRPGFGFQVFIDTTYPVGWGAQGNAAGGFMVTTPVSNPPAVNTPTIGVVGGHKVFTNVAGSTGYVQASSISVVNGKKVFTTVTGGPATNTETVVAYFYPLGLTPQGLVNGRNQLLTALNKLRAGGYTFWVQTVGAVAFEQKGWTA
jgi:hypothetical protein